MSLKQKLEEIHAGLVSRIPPDKRAIMERTTNDLRNSGILAGVAGVGQKAPDFTGTAHDGRTIAFSDLLGRGPVVLSFFRGHWWPYCRAELDALQANYEDIKQLGAELVVFSSETNAISKDLADKQRLGFPIVRDEELKISRAYGLAFQLPDDLLEVYSGFGINIPKNTGRDAWELPMPARFVIDKEGIIRAADVDPDYTKRPEPEETIAVLRSIAWYKDHTW